MLKVASLSFGLVLLLVACNTNKNSYGSTPNELLTIQGNNGEFKRNYLLWERQNIDSYQITFRRICFCLDEYILPVDITVENGEKVKVVYNEVVDLSQYPDVPEEPDPANYLDIEEAFGLIAGAIKRKPAVLEVIYDKEYGFPVEAYIDESELIVDEEVYFTITSFLPNN